MRKLSKGLKAKGLVILHAVTISRIKTPEGVSESVCMLKALTERRGACLCSVGGSASSKQLPFSFCLITGNAMYLGHGLKGRAFTLGVK